MLCRILMMLKNDLIGGLKIDNKSHCVRPASSSILVYSGGRRARRGARARGFHQKFTWG